MQKLKSFTFAILVGIAALGLTPSPAKALVIYSYTGNFFDTFVDSTLPAGSYDTTMSVSGSFTVAAPLLSIPVISDIRASVLSYSFSDGRQTLDSTNSFISIFELGTGPAGGVLGWRINLFIGFPSPSPVGTFSRNIETWADPSEPTSFSPRDEGRIQECTLAIGPLDDLFCVNGTNDLGVIQHDQGAWNISTVAVPEPSTLLLFGVGLAGLAGFGRRRRQV